MDQLASNPITQILAQESDLPYARDITLFLYALHVLKDRSNKKGSNFVSQFLLTYVRAFGAMGFALPLVLGTLPSDILKDMDNYAVYVIAAMVYNSFGVSRFFPKFFNDATHKFNNLAYYIVKGNLAGAGYAAAQGAFGDSFLGPLVGAYVAVQGQKFIEGGVSSVNDNTFDEDGLLGCFSGLFIYLSGTYLELSAYMARVVLVLFRASNEVIPWGDHFAKFCVSLTKLASGAAKRASSAKKGGKAMKRGRSRTPMRR